MATDSLLQLLRQMQAEAERHQEQAAELEKQRCAFHCQSADLAEAIRRVEVEMKDIDTKCVESAGHARAVAEILEAEQGLEKAVNLELEALEAELTQAVAGLEEMQRCTVDECATIAGELRGSRTAFHKQLCNRRASTCCELRSLEVELTALGQFRTVDVEQS